MKTTTISTHQIRGQKEHGKNHRIDREVKDLRDAGISPDETRSQDADRHDKATRKKIR